jgi:ankyrin repeat protein
MMALRKYVILRSRRDGQNDMSKTTTIAGMRRGGTVVEGSMVRIRQLSVWWIALAIGWAAPAVAGPSDDFYYAVAYGNAAKARALLDEGADANAKRGGIPMLITASQRGYLDIVRALLAEGAEVDARWDTNGWTALMAASTHGDLDVVQVLLDKGADVNAKDAHGTTALWAAAQSGHREVVQGLLDKGADANAKADAYRGETALFTAAAADQREVVQVLLDNGADVNAKTTDGKTALFTASTAGNLGVVQVLLAKGADLNARDAAGMTVLMAASRVKSDARHREVVQALLDKGAVGRGWSDITPWLAWLASPTIIVIVLGFSLLLAWGIWSALRVRHWAVRLGIYTLPLAGAFGFCTWLQSNLDYHLWFFVLAMLTASIFGGGRVQM